MRKRLNREVIRLRNSYPDETNAQLASRLGVLPQYISVTLKRQGLPKARRPSFEERPKTVSPRIPNNIADKLSHAAARRCMTTNQLIIALVTVIANDGMVDAILDDAGRFLEAAE
jgi:hypothetical protein